MAGLLYYPTVPQPSWAVSHPSTQVQQARLWRACRLFHFNEHLTPSALAPALSCSRARGAAQAALSLSARFPYATLISLSISLRLHQWTPRPSILPVPARWVRGDARAGGGRRRVDNE